MKRQIKKSDLYDYVNRMVSKRILQEQARYNGYWALEVKTKVHEAFVKAYEGTLDTNFKALKSGLTELFDALPCVGTHAYDLRRANEYLNNMSSIVNVASGALRAELQSKIHSGKDYEELLRSAFSGDKLGALLSMCEEYAELRNEGKAKEYQLEILRGEAKKVVHLSKSGKDGHLNLVALSFPMEDFALEVATNLPAIQKFSVDTCILTNDCKEGGGEQAETS